MSDSPTQAPVRPSPVAGPEPGQRRLRRIVSADERTKWLPKVVPFLSLLLIVIAFSGQDGFVSARNLSAILRELPILLLIASAATLPILLGSIDLSLGGILALSGGTAVVLVPEVGEAALILGPLVGLAAGLLNGLVIVLGRLPSFLVTLGSLFAFGGIANLVMGGLPHAYTGSFSSALGGSISILGVRVTYIFLVAAAIVALLVFLITSTSFGRYVMAVGGGERVARLAGIKVRRVKVTTFAVAGLLAGTAGTLLAMRSLAATPTMGDPYLLTMIAAVVIGGTSLSGGVGGPQWTVLGAFVILTLDNGMTLAGINPDYQTIIRGLVIIVASALTTRRLSDVIK